MAPTLGKNNPSATRKGMHGNCRNNGTGGSSLSFCLIRPFRFFRSFREFP
jgi:hypothetical protein